MVQRARVPPTGQTGHDCSAAKGSLGGIWRFIPITLRDQAIMYLFTRLPSTTSPSHSAHPAPDYLFPPQAMAAS